MPDRLDRQVSVHDYAAVLAEGRSWKATLEQ